jgi:hypothetical protein
MLLLRRRRAHFGTPMASIRDRRFLRFDEAHDRGMLVEEIEVVLEEHSDLGETELPMVHRTATNSKKLR